jgi:hypothetical protein
MRAAALAIALLLASLGGALAQNAVAPVMGSSGDAEMPLAEDPDQQTQILVLGDAVGGGLGAGLMRMAEIDGRYDVSIRFNEESGLARPDVYDWVETLPKILEANSFDVIVVLLGTNDRQMIRSGNERYAFNTPNWLSLYEKRLDALLEELAASKAKIYWVGLPPMAEAGYDADLRAISDLQRKHVEARGYSYLDIRSAFLTAEGQYTDTGPDDTGEVRRLRGRDGISFFKAGNNRMGQLVLAAVQSGDLPEAAQPKGDKFQKAAIDTQREPLPPRLPVFGQTLMGEPVTLDAQDVVVNATVVAGSTVNPKAALEALKAMSPPGSGAEKLFRLGQAAAAPAGRADDFTAPPKPQ